MVAGPLAPLSRGRLRLNTASQGEARPQRGPARKRSRATGAGSGRMSAHFSDSSRQFVGRSSSEALQGQQVALGASFPDTLASRGERGFRLSAWHLSRLRGYHGRRGRPTPLYAHRGGQSALV